MLLKIIICIAGVLCGFLGFVTGCGIKKTYDAMQTMRDLEEMGRR